MRHPIGSGILLAALCLWVAIGGPAQASTVTEWNFDPAWPTTSPGGSFAGFTGFEVILPGNQTATTTEFYNSFSSPTTTVTFNGSQTTILFTSSTNSTIGLGPGTPVPHFGFSGLATPVTMEWLYGSGSTLSVPGLGVNITTGPTGPTSPYLIEYVTATSGGVSTGNWFELPYQGNYQTSFIGSTGSGVTLSDAGFFLSPTEIPLDQLNQQDYPPTSSEFKPIPGISDGTMLMSGGSILGATTPLPAALPLFASGLGLMGFLAWRRTHKRAVAWSMS